MPITSAATAVAFALLSLALGIGLSAACGFRVFVPLFIMSIAALSGYLTLDGGFAWIATYPALASFGAATLVEILGYYIPWVDNLLDAVATPTAIVAGMVVTASSVTEVDPFLRWTLAIVGGGGTAAVFQGITATARQVSSFTTGGLGNPVIATLEAGGSALLAVLAIMVPILAALVLVVLLYFGVKRLLFRRPARAT